MNGEEFDRHHLEPATADRLEKLRAMPVDTSQLDQMIQARIPRMLPQPRRLLLRPLRLALAAGVILVASLVAILIATSGGTVMASTADMVQFHDDLVSGKVPVMHVDSMQAANKALAEQWAQSPKMPNVPSDHVMACCMRSVKNKKMACVLLKGEGQPVTMTVANATDMQMPTCPVEMRNGIEYRVRSVGSLNMVMTLRNGRWICLIARLPVNRLMDLASSLEF